MSLVCRRYESESGVGCQTVLIVIGEKTRHSIKKMWHLNIIQLPNIHTHRKNNAKIVILGETSAYQVLLLSPLFLYKTKLHGC